MPKRLREYLVTVPVILSGTQTFLVDATSEEDAIAKVTAGKGEYETDDLQTDDFKINQARAEVNE